ncbi:TPKB [Symbiodinium pilosum]|uniref:TPKB protein n=1 Tax=Symbiodinium pilosum TaxID=2952 RepID=A0A812WTK2_SYMPI|nr:TPKB [Symbiodinium pilosum]
MRRPLDCHVRSGCPTRAATCLTVCGFYCLLGATIYNFLEPEWNFTDCLYFSFVTTTTVGYGCLAPTSTGSRAFTMVYAFFSVPFITGTLAEFQRAWLSLCFRAWRWMLSRCLPTSEVGNWIHIEESHVWVLSAVHFYFWGIVELATFLAATASMMMLIMWALFRGVPGAFVSTLENTEAFQMGLFDSIYYFVITSTTVGYGDVCPRTATAKMWSIIVASYGIGLIIMWADHLNRLWQTRQLHLREARILQRELDPSLIEEFDVSGDGQVTELEYVLAMLRSLELVNMDVVGPILDRFNALDKDGNGVLDRDDLQRLLLRRCDQIESQHSRPRLRRMSRRFIGRTGTFNNQIARTSSSRVEEEEEDATKDATKSTYI